MTDIDDLTARFHELGKRHGFDRTREIIDALCDEFARLYPENQTPEKRAEFFERAFRERYGV